MGLLDDAIREHLELKRRSGADPGEIAHKEHEALAPVFPDEETIALDAAEGSTGADPLAEQHTDVAQAEGSHAYVAEDHDFTHIGQETAEIDMRTVLDEHGDSQVAPVAARPISAEQTPGDPDHTSAEWGFESSSNGASEDAGLPQEIPGQERLSFE